jgi:hypothetical protein
MAERLKDKEDLRLEAMFRSAPVPDDGFTTRVVSRVRRRIWVRRLSLPIAIAVGAAISARPILEVVSVVPALINSLFGSTFNIEGLVASDLPQISTMLRGAGLAAAVFLGSKLLED